MPVVIGGLILAFLVMMLFGGTELDRALLTLLDGAALPNLTQTAAVIDWCARPLPLAILIAAGGGLLAARRQGYDAALLGGIALSGWLITLAVQRLTAPLRPASDAMRVVETGFPNGSAAIATIAGFALAFLLTRHAPARAWALAAAAVFALTAGASAVILDRAWPTGVIGGWALGLAWTLLVLLIACADLGDGHRRGLSPPRTPFGK